MDIITKTNERLFFFSLIKIKDMIPKIITIGGDFYFKIFNVDKIATSKRKENVHNFGYKQDMTFFRIKVKILLCYWLPSKTYYDSLVIQIFSPQNMVKILTSFHPKKKVCIA